MHEEGITPAADARRWGTAPAPPHVFPAGGLQCDTPITVYSEAAEMGTQQGPPYFGTLPAPVAGPHGKRCDFRCRNPLTPSDPSSPGASAAA